MYRHVVCLAIAGALVSTVAAEDTTRRVIGAGEWKTSGKIGDFGEIRATRDQNAWVLRPSADDPDFSFGWIEGPVFAAFPATDTLSGNNVGMRVVYTFSSAVPGAAPELRIRLNSDNFGQYAIAAVANNRFQEIKGVGGGAVTVLFDRRQLSSETRFIPYIDLLSAGTGVSPDWFVRIESVETFIPVSNASFERERLIATAYMEGTGNVYAHLGASANRTPVYTRTGSGPASFAYDGAHIIVIDNGRLFGFSSTTGFARVDIATANVIYGGISEHHVGYLERGGRAFYFNLLTREKRSLDPSASFFAVAGAGDGSLTFIKRRGNGTLELFQYDTRLLNPSLTRLNGDNAALIVNSRSTLLTQ